MKRLKTLFLPFGVLVLLGSARPARGDLCAYVANGGSDYISVIDMATNSLVAEIDVHGSPRSVAVDPTGQSIYAVVDGTLAVIDAGTYIPLREIPLPEGYPDTVVIAPDGTVAYVGDYWQNSIVFVDTRTGLSRSVPVFGDLYLGGASVRFALGPNGSLLYVPLPQGDARVAVVDTKRGSVASVFAVLPDLELPMASAIALSPDGQTAYLLLTSASVIPIVDTTTQTVSGVIQASGTSLALAPDGYRLYVAASGVLRIVDLNTQAITTVTLAEVRSPVVLALAPAQNALLIADDSSQTVAVVDTTTHLLRAQISVGVGPRDIAVGRINGPCRPVAYTPEPTDTPTPTPTATPTKVPLPQCPEGVPCLSVSSVAGRPGNDLTVEVRLHTAGWNIAGTENDILFDPGLSLHDCTAGDGSVTILTRESTSSLRALVFGGSLVAPRSIGPIADGTVLYRCTLTIAQDAPVGMYYLRTVRIVGADPAGQSVIIIGADGTVLVSGQTDPQAQTAASPAGKSGCAIGGNDAPQWWFPLALLLPPLRRLLRGPGLREQRLRP